MGLIAFLSSAVGGTLLSGVTQLANEWFAIRRMKAESEIKMAELTKMAEIKMDEAALKAFTEAQKGAASSDWKPTDKTPVGLTWAFGIAEIIIKLVRPAMVVAAFFIIFTTLNDSQGELREEMLAAVHTFCFSVGYFWLGQRYLGKAISSKK